MKTGRDGKNGGDTDSGGALRGIVIARGEDTHQEPSTPRIAAFIWGGKVRPSPTLPYGRWKGAA